MRINPVNSHSIFIKRTGFTQKHPSALKRFKRETRLPSLPKDPRAAVRRMLERKSNFHRQIGSSFEKLKNPRAAIRAYEHAKHYTPSDMSLFKNSLRIRINFFRELKA